MDKLGNLLLLQEPYIHVLFCKHHILNGIIEKYSFMNKNNKKAFLTAIEGNNCVTVESLMKEFAIKLKFPNYFGENWAAFDECINDLEWLESEKYILFIRNFDKVLLCNKEFEVFFNILNSTINEWVSGREYDSFPTPPTPFHLVLHCEAENLEKLKLILSNLDIYKFEKILL